VHLINLVTLAKHKVKTTWRWWCRCIETWSTYNT